MQDFERIITMNMYKFKKMNEIKFVEIMREYNLRRIDLEIILYLSSCGDNDTAKDISDNQAFTKGHISQSVKRLNEMGYIELICDEDDKRVHHLKTTDKVNPILNIISSHKNEIEEKVLMGVTEKEREALCKITSKICKNINKEMEIMEKKK